MGLGEYVGAAGQVAEALKLGAAGADTVGYALVLAAADWRRCGMTRPVPAAMLSSLAEPHLDQRGRAKLSDQDIFSAGLAWATRDINPNVSLLQPAGPDSYIVYDYALDLISQQGTPVPAASWAVVRANADASELLDIGYAAEVTYHRTETAIQAFHEAMSPAMYEDLKKIASGHFGEYVRGAQLDRELRFLRDYGFIGVASFIYDIPEEGPNLSAYVWVTVSGKSFVEFRERQTGGN